MCVTLTCVTLTEMSVCVTLTCSTETDRSLSVSAGHSVTVGRADTSHRAAPDNSFFNCKVTVPPLTRDSRVVNQG